MLPKLPKIRVIITLVLFSALFFAAASPARAAMKLLTPEVGWLAGGKGILWTTDAGASWKDITPPLGPRAGIGSVFFLDTFHGWALISYRGEDGTHSHFDLASTSTAGTNWSLTPVTVPDRYARSQVLAGGGIIHFLDTRHGWMNLSLVSSSNFRLAILLATQDGGRTWDFVPEGPGVSGRVRFVTAKDGWLAGHPGKLFATHDGGRSWQELALQPPAQVGEAIYPNYDLPVFRDRRHGFLPVSYRGPEGAPPKLVVYSTDDGGRTWRLVRVLAASRGVPIGVRVAVAIADSVLVVPTGSGLEGTSVTIAHVPLTGEAGSSVVFSPGGASLSFADSAHGWVSIQRGLLCTVDGGVTWTDISPGRAKKVPAAVSALSPASVWTSSKTASPPSSTYTANMGMGGGGGGGGGGGAGGLHRSVHLGFDQCEAGSANDMQPWWTESPYYDVNIYIGGENRGCSQPNLNSTWVTQVTDQGWGLIPTWVGKQAPCTLCPNCSTFDLNETVAYAQGEAEADEAANDASDLGLFKTLIYLDIENYDHNDEACGDAVTAFVSGWVSKMHSKSYTAGVYGNPAPAKKDFTQASPLPDAVWIAKYDDRATIWGLNPLEDSHWANSQRIHRVLLCPRSQTRGDLG